MIRSLLTETSLRRPDLKTHCGVALYQGGVPNLIEEWHGRFWIPIALRFLDNEFILAPYNGTLR